MNGFSETRQLLLGKAGLATNYVSTTIASQRKKEAVPEGIKRSPWFLPSIGQWFNMLENIGGRSPRDFGDNTAFGLNDLNWGQETLDKLTEQLSKVGSSLPAFKDDFRLGFSCSSQYNETRSWMLLWHIGDPDYPLGIGSAYKDSAKVQVGTYACSSHSNHQKRNGIKARFHALYGGLYHAR